MATVDKIVAQMPKSLSKVEFSYCPGCHHGIVHRIIAEVIDELGIAEKTLMVAPVGCSVFAYNFFDLDGTVAAHGRAPAVATGMKRALPDRIVFTYQGDGDLASIGTAEIVHAANRGENITTIFINNAVYGMTGGQMAPTTLIGQKTTTSPYGREPKANGYPIRMSEMLSTLEGAVYIERTMVTTPQNVIKTKAAIKKAFQAQIKGLGFSMIEVLSTCPTNWGMTPIEAMKWLEENMTKTFPLGVFVDKTKGMI
ncbi:thiamine pyrophosphate-dependent enzyme [Athalassotoga saccharophila]|uniref:thiamine pyrophosphate-dependent enzyme n=1 Tax=Athalassotoga saccharophila TaxID=1441386 RepID=UPI00137A1AF5|nr:thiamine pyrophosphate-dependent enzyme [Athalassotoga saccharophila]BBJ28729.1 2-oxoglutarate/2-oxoacid ferredoxin oxidoreductase, beta subunit [Athalassotoga saccharophila]